MDYRTDRALHLRGRGIRIVPTYFSWGTPVALAAADLPPVLSYPLNHPAVPEGALPAEHVPLGALLGSTRARVLRYVADGLTTGELAQVAGISQSAASRHASVLRDAGLTTSRQIGPTVLHTLTPLGAALLASDGRDPGVCRILAGSRSRGWHAASTSPHVPARVPCGPGLRFITSNTPENALKPR